MDNDTILRLAQLSRMLDEATVEYARLDDVAIRAKMAAEYAHDKAYMGGDGPVEARKAQARIDTYRERLDAEVSVAQVRHVQERIRTLRSQIEVGRSLNAAQRSEWQAG